MPDALPFHRLEAAAPRIWVATISGDSCCGDWCQRCRTCIIFLDLSSPLGHFPSCSGEHKPHVVGASCTLPINSRRSLRCCRPMLERRCVWSTDCSLMLNHRVCLQLTPCHSCTDCLCHRPRHHHRRPRYRQRHHSHHLPIHSICRPEEGMRGVTIREERVLVSSCDE